MFNSRLTDVPKGNDSNQHVFVDFLHILNISLILWQIIQKKKEKRIIQKIIFLESTKENPFSNGAKEDPITEVPKENLKKNHINEDPKEDPINRKGC